MVSGQKKVGGRSLDEIREHYILGKELANRLKNASKEERRELYSSLYDELFRRIPSHPQLTRKATPAESVSAVDSKTGLLVNFLNQDTTFLEIGPGDCALSFAAAKIVKKVYAVDVSAEITKSAEVPKNFELIISDGTSIPVDCVDVAYSNQLMEHLHPEDAAEQLMNIYNALTPGGVYVCITPSRLTGPHDVSRYFDSEATCFHLKEYTASELAKLFKSVGFSKTTVYCRLKGKYFHLPIGVVRCCEAVMSMMPRSMRKSLGRKVHYKYILGAPVVGVK